MSLGSAISKTVRFSMPYVDYLFNGKKVIVYIGLQTDVGVEWIKKATLNIVKTIKKENLLCFECYDSFYFCEKTFTTNLKGLQKIKTIVNEQCTKLGITYINNIEDVSYNVDLLKGLTIREALGYLSAYCGKNAHFNENDELEFMWYTECGYKIGPDRYSSPLDVVEQDTTINSLTCITKKSITDEDGNQEQIDETLVSGDGFGIIFSCLGMTQDRLNVLFNRIKGFSYRSCSLDLLISYPELEVGDIVEVNDLDGSIYYVPIMEENSKCDGGYQSAIQSFSKTENDYEFKGSLATQIERNYQEYASFKQVIADDIKAFNGEFTKVNTDILNVNKELTAIKANIGDLNVDELTARVATIETSYVNKQYVNENYVGVQYANQTYAVKSEVKDLTADVAKINTLLSGSVTAGSTQTIVLNAENTTIANALIKSANIESVNAGIINSGTLNTNLVHIQSQDGGVKINGNTQQFLDKNNKVRVQIGRDAQNNFNFLVVGEDGTTAIFNQNGITSKAVPDGLIVDQMVSDGANIQGSKLDIDSVITEVNGATTTIKSSRIYFDEKKQTLDVAFNTMSNTVTETTKVVETANTNANNALSKANTAITDSASAKTTAESAKSVADGAKTTADGANTKATTASTNASNALAKANQLETKVTTVENTMKTQSTQISTAQGQISTLITDVTQAKKDITATKGDITTAKANITTLTNNYSSVKQTVDGLNTTVGSHTSQLTTIKGTADSALSLINGLEIGGRNYIVLGKITSYASYNTAPTVNGNILTSTWNASYTNGTFTIAISGFSPKNKVYTLSGYLKVNGAIPNVKYFTGMASTYGSSLQRNEYDPKTGYFVITQTYSGSSNWILHGPTTRKSGSTDVVTIEKLKFEEGNKPTDWTPAPEDVDSSISTVDGRVTAEIKKVTDKQSVFENTINGIASRVSSTETSITTVTKTVEDTKTLATNAKTVADSKAKIFIATPTTPYKVGDLWTQGASGVIMRCKVARASGAYVASDWEKADKYTDDTVANKVRTDLTASIKTVTDKQASFETTLNGITSRVSKTETNITTINGNITNLTTRMSSAEQKVTDSAIVATVTKSSSWSTLNTKATDAQTKANTLVDLTTIKDTRSVNNNPQWYFTNYPKKTVREFKSCTTVGISNDGTYGTLETTTSWAESSGGYPVQLFYPNNSQNIYRRVGTSTTAWGAWTKIAGTHNAVSVINQTAESIKIQASKIALEGLVTANSRFKILTDGSMEAVNGKFSGSITATSGNIAGFALSSSRMSASATKTFNYTESDRTTIRNFITNGGTPTTAQMQRLDINGDGKLTSSDYVVIGKIINAGNKISTTFSISPTFSTTNFNEGVLNVSVAGFGTTKITSTGYLYSSQGTFDGIVASGATIGNVTIGSDSGNANDINCSGMYASWGGWLGKISSLGDERLGFYNAYKGTRKGWIGHNGTNALYIWNENGGDVNLVIGTDRVILQPASGTYSGYFMPNSDGRLTLGTTAHRWYRLYQSYASVSTSDRREKRLFNKFDERYEKMFVELKPQTYEFIKENGAVRHSGFIAQDVQETMHMCNIRDNEFAGLQHQKANDYYGLAYEEFIALNTHMIQKNITKLSQHDIEIQKLRNENARLKQELINTQAKLDAFISGNFEFKTVTREVA